MKAEIIAKLRLKTGEAITEENIENFEEICSKAEETLDTLDSEGGASRSAPPSHFYRHFRLEVFNFRLTS